MGVDVGTTNIAVLVVDACSGTTKAVSVVANSSEVTSEEDKLRGRSEWDAEKATDLVYQAMAEAAVKADPGKIGGIGITGQMHGMVLVSQDNRPLTPFIGWQDQRCNEKIPGRDISYIERMLELAGEDGFECEGCLPATGYMGATLFWLKENDVLPDEPSTPCFLPDFVAMRMTDNEPVTDPTNAGSSGIFDVIHRQWDQDLIRRLGLQEIPLPEVKKPTEIIGGLISEASRKTGLPEGTPVCVACGDNQASFLGSVADKHGSVLVNIGTGGQVSLWTPKYTRVMNAETRCYLDEGYLLVGADTCGGSSYALLHRFFLDVGRAFFGARGNENLYEMIMRQAAEIPPGAEGLRCEPFFSGSRLDPSRRASWLGFTESNFTCGHLTRALLEGLAHHFRALYESMLRGGVSPRTCLVGSGNGIRKNALLAEIFSNAFRMPLKIPLNMEEAAYGAALLAAVGCDKLDLEEASRLILYQ
jgi:sugar (pentulose or hexulose) kinase